MRVEAEGGNGVKTCVPGFAPAGPPRPGPPSASRNFLRIAPGAIQHCAHGKASTLHDIVDWRPFDYVTWHIHTPMGTVVRQMAEFTPRDDGGTHLSLRSVPPESSNPLAQAFVRLTMPLIRGKLVREQRASKVALEKLVADDLAATRDADAVA